LYNFGVSNRGTVKGVEALKVFGPPGMKSFVDFLLPFINRKFPRLDIFEVIDYLEWKCVGGMVKFFPVCTQMVLNVLNMLSTLS
jgi:hypothetical protein